MLAFLEVFILLAFLVGWGLMEWRLHRLDRRRAAGGSAGQSAGPPGRAEPSDRTEGGPGA